MEKFEGPESIKIKRVPKPGYFGLSSYPKSVTTIVCQTGKKGYLTGLTPDEERFYEKALELKPGELSKHSKWWTEVFNTEHAIRLFNTKTNELILDNPIDQLRYKVLLAHERVANSEIEKNNPNAIFYIDNEELKAKKELETINFEIEGMKLIFGLDTEEKRNCLRLFNKKGVDEISENMASTQLVQELRKNPKHFFDILTDKELKTKMFIFELVEKGILKRSGNYFINNEDTIANTLEECVEWMQDVKHQSTRLAFETKLKKSKKVAVK